MTRLTLPSTLRTACFLLALVFVGMTSVGAPTPAVASVDSVFSAVQLDPTDTTYDFDDSAAGKNVVLPDCAPSQSARKGQHPTYAQRAGAFNIRAPPAPLLV